MDKTQARKGATMKNVQQRDEISAKRRMIHKRTAVIMAAILLLIALNTGCAARFQTQQSAADAATSEAANESSSSMPEFAREEEMPMAVPLETGVGELETVRVFDTSRKLIYTANFVMETYYFETSYNSIVDAVNAARGYIGNENTEGTKPEKYGDAGRVANMQVRVPITEYDTFIRKIAGYGKISRKSQNTQDISAEYFDTDARISMLEKRYERLKQHLDNTTKMADIIELEKDMSEILYQLDSYKGQKRVYDDLVTYSTVNIELYEKVASNEIPVSDLTFGARVSRGWNDVTKWLSTFFTGLAIILLAGSPVILLVAGIALAIVLPIRISRKKKQAKADAAAKQAPTLK